ncbi:MAG: nucleotidyltransferase domain-containing protein [Anaerolineae bacterium]|nr:nucleotidyltransferase domain-containing protein [Anaerolineae bacterium]MDW8069299.1 nucleotidyltransferase domain-containing protein [Anaerolineae bacterium]
MTELEEIVRQLREMGACGIILFGSRVRSRARRESDIDRLVIGVPG